MERYPDNHVVFPMDGKWYFKAKVVDFNRFIINYQTKGGFATEEEAALKYELSAKQFKKDIERIKKSTDIKYTFTEYLEHWYEEEYAPYARASVNMVYAWGIYQIIFPAIESDVLINRVNATYLTSILDRCSSFCDSAAPMAKKILSIALGDAVKSNFLKENPVKKVKSYPWKQRKITVLNTEQLKAFLKEARMYQSIYLEILLGLFCGLRIGEIRGLRYDDFNLEEKTLSIRRQRVSESKARFLKSANAEAEPERDFFAPPKTINSFRTLKIPDIILEELAVRKSMNGKILSKFPENEAKYGPYVSISQLGNITSTATISAGIKRIARRAGIPDNMTCHSLRHCFCSILIEQNVPLETISKLMGHRYVHTTFDLYCGIMDAKGVIKELIQETMDPVFYVRPNE